MAMAFKIIVAFSIGIPLFGVSDQMYSSQNIFAPKKNAKDNRPPANEFLDFESYLVLRFFSF